MIKIKSVWRTDERSNYELSYQCLETKLGFLPCLDFREFLYRSSLSVVWGGKRFLLALTIHAAIWQSRSKPPEVAGIASSFLAMPWSLGKRVADFQYSTVELFSSSGSDRYTSSSDLFMVFAGDWRKVKMDLRFRSFSLILLRLASIGMMPWFPSSPPCPVFNSLFVRSSSTSSEDDAEVSMLFNLASTMARAWSFDRGVSISVWTSRLASGNGWKKGEGENSCCFSFFYLHTHTRTYTYKYP